MYGFLLVIHVIVCLLLVTIVLIQSGRGGGLTESFSSAESIFGTKTNIFLTRATTVLATLFVITCLSLAFISTKRSKSLMGQVPQKIEEGTPISAEEELPREDKEGVSLEEPQETNAETIPVAQ